ncbi:unnamed protein product [Nezara viridula]|uniref:F-box domain-containing protein n=1 Tax=Nezara viridula TaxID=85310 RepID=A0A9P0GY01_NEZVI|nr:unnamed protein product [Nezara viridula]
MLMKRAKVNHIMPMERRFTRSLLSAKMDFIPLLPVEISQLIFRRLTVKELARCLGVSKRWRELANINYLWKRHCLIYGLEIDEDKKFQRNAKCDLCKWAQIWFNFRRSAAFGWRSKIWKTREIDKTNMYMRNASDGESLVFCTGSVLTVRKISQLGKTKYSLRLPLPHDASSCLAVDNRYVAVAKCNIVLIYKIGINRYNCCMALAMNGDVILKTRKYVRRFVKANIKETSSCVCIIALSNGCIWLREHGRYKTFVINLINEKVTQVETHFYRFVTRTYIVSWSRRKLRVDNFKGRNILKLCRDVNKARANHHVLVTFGFTSGREDIEQVMETWELSTGKRLLCMPRPKNAFFEIHPSRDILYQIEAEKDYITSLCPVTGRVFWYVRVPNIKDILDWCLRVVCGRYLVLFQYKSSAGGHTLLYVFDAICGRYLYKAERPPGHLEHLSDNLIVVKSSNKIYLRTFS